MSQADSNEPFSYNGFLQFQVLALPEGSDKNNIVEFVDSLCSSDPATSPPNQFFRRRHIDGLSSDQYPSLSELQGEIHVAQFVREKFESEVTVETESGERVSGLKVSEQTTDCIFLPTGRVLLRGPKSEFSEAIRQINAALQTEEMTTRVEFDPNFFLWLFWQHYQRSSTLQTYSLEPVTLNTAHIVTNDDALVDTIEYSGNDIVESAVFLIDLLRGGTIQSLGGIFKFDGRFVELRIKQDSSIHIHVSEALSGMSQVSRYLLAVKATNRFSEQYERWRNLPKKKRYPPQEFFVNLKEDVESQGVQTNFSLIDSVSPILELRGEKIE